MNPKRYYRTEDFWHRVEFAIGGEAHLWSKGSEQQALFDLAANRECIQALAPISRLLSPRQVAAAVRTKFLLS